MAAAQTWPRRIRVLGTQREPVLFERGGKEGMTSLWKEERENNRREKVSERERKSRY